MSALEILAVVVSFAGIWLTARRQLWCWPVNLLACALYFKVFLDVRLYADMVLQALFAMGIVYGWIAWARGKESTGAVLVQPLSPPAALGGLGAGALAAIVIGWITSHHTDAALPWMDAALTAFSLVGQYWTARRHAASWLLWIVVDTIYVGMFLFKELWPTAGLYLAMTVLAVLGYRRWMDAARRHENVRSDDAD